MTKDTLKTISDLQNQFKFTVSLDPADDKIMTMKFESGRTYILQHPGALQAAKLFGRDSDSLTAECLEYFIQNCIRPVADGKTKSLNNETMDLEETMELWLPFAWRWLRWSYKILS